MFTVASGIEFACQWPLKLAIFTTFSSHLVSITYEEIDADVTSDHAAWHRALRTYTEHFVRGTWNEALVLGTTDEVLSSSDSVLDTLVSG